MYVYCSESSPRLVGLASCVQACSIHMFYYHPYSCLPSLLVLSLWLSLSWLSSSLLCCHVIIHAPMHRSYTCQVFKTSQISWSFTPGQEWPLPWCFGLCVWWVPYSSNKLVRWKGIWLRGWNELFGKPEALGNWTPSYSGSAAPRTGSSSILVLRLCLTLGLQVPAENRTQSAPLPVFLPAFKSQACKMLSSNWSGRNAEGDTTKAHIRSQCAGIRAQVSWTFS